MELIAKVPWEIWLIVAESALILVLLVILITSMRKNKKKNELRSYVAEQSRDDRLREALGNEYATQQTRDVSARNIPYQVEYHDSPEARRDTSCIQITQKSPLSTEKYIYHIHDVLRIGSDPQNEIVLKEPEAVPCDAHLVRENNALYVKKMMPESKILFMRDKKTYALNEKLLRLRSGDILVIGKTQIGIEILNV